MTVTHGEPSSPGPQTALSQTKPAPLAGTPNGTSAPTRLHPIGMTAALAKTTLTRFTGWGTPRTRGRGGSNHQPEAELRVRARGRTCLSQRLRAGAGEPIMVSRPTFLDRRARDRGCLVVVTRKRGGPGLVDRISQPGNQLTIQ